MKHQGFNPFIFSVRPGFLFVVGVLFLGLAVSVLSDVHPAELPVIYFFVGVSLVVASIIRRKR